MKKTIVIDPKIRFGKPIIANTRITVEEVLGALAGGMGFNDIEQEYGLTKEQILSALRYVAGWIKGEETRNYAISS
ncbi:MAG: DUF433 domain-containing protein [Candidatus Levybacteria bacterium]|nr:DUF433 domain-containing protein [Candidatus Levybacteria bacterium]